jgi:isopenicillin N synthase-like dioxygenase
MSSDAIPIIDLAPLRQGQSGLKDVAAALGTACRGIGFFYLIGHGLSAGLNERVFMQSKTFFDLPEAEKRALQYSADTGNRGFVPIKGEALDPNKPPDIKEAFNMGLNLPPDHPEIVNRERFRAPNLWPKISGFRQTMLPYFDELWGIGRLLHKAFATDLGISPDYFEDKLDRPLATLRLLHYPPLPDNVQAGQLGAGAHTDYGCVTLLSTDEVGGLEVRTRAGEWLKAPYAPLYATLATV